MRWSLPLRVLKTARKRCVLRCHHKELYESDEQTEPRRKFQIVGAAAQKERELKTRLVQRTYKRLEVEDKGSFKTSS